VQRQALRAVGGFDERFTAWDDARDLQFTLAEVSGDVVAAPAAIVERPEARGGWDATLHQYRKILFDALSSRSTRASIASASAAARRGAITRSSRRSSRSWPAPCCARPPSAWAGLIAWTGLTAALVARRMRVSAARGTRRGARHLGGHPAHRGLLAPGRRAALSRLLPLSGRPAGSQHPSQHRPGK
jgi:hypothetical protein